MTTTNERTAIGSRAAIARDHIREALLGGQYHPGEKLPIQDFVDRLGISRQPVMAAIQSLADDGLIDVLPQVGCRAADHGRDQIADFYRYFAACEGLMAALAAERARPGEAEELARLGTEIDAIPADAEPATYRRRNRAFHAHIHAMARSPELSRRINVLWDRSDYYITVLGALARIASLLPVVHDEHEAICDAIAQGAPVAARAAMEAHILRTGRGLDDR